MKRRLIRKKSKPKFLQTKSKPFIKKLGNEKKLIRKKGTQNMGGDISGWSSRPFHTASYDERDL